MSQDITKEVKVQRVKNYSMVGHEVCKVSIQGKEFAEVTYMERHPQHMGGTIRHLKNGQYQVISTGEIKQVEYTGERNRTQLLRTFARLKGLIRENFSSDTDNQVFVTLTYKRNMKDAEQLYTDFHAFIKRLRYAYKQHALEYIAVAEPQERGAWHLHVMIKSMNQDKLWIDKDKLAALWRQGGAATNIERLKSNDVGRYYVAYFTDLVAEAKEINKQTANKKKYKKGSRLKLYPPNFNFYRCSRGIVEPKSIDTEWFEVQRIYGEPVYTQTIKITEIDVKNPGTERKINVIHKASFRKKGGAEIDELLRAPAPMDEPGDVLQAIASEIEECQEYIEQTISEYLKECAANE